MGWSWQEVGDEVGYPWCACRIAAALGSQPARPWLVGPYSAPGFLTGQHSLGMGRTGTGTDNQVWVMAREERNGKGSSKEVSSLTPNISFQISHYLFPPILDSFPHLLSPYLLFFFFFNLLFTSNPFQFGFTQY